MKLSTMTPRSNGKVAMVKHITSAALKRLRRKVRKSVKSKTKSPFGGKGMNVNETRFNNRILNGVGVYEPFKFAITKTGKRKYTPDFSYATPVGTIAFIEVKGSYKLGSEDRARLAWELAAESRPEYDFVWARYNRGKYECELWTDGGSEISKRSVRNKEEFDNMLSGRCD